MAKEKKVTSNSLTKWDEQLAKLAQSSKALVDELGGGGQFISIRGGILSTQEGVVPGGKMNAVIINSILENDFYDPEKPFDPDNPTSPICYAFGETVAEMRPHPNASDPQGGPDGGCKGCPQNAFGTADRGKGKACQNRVRMQLITEGDLADIAKADVRMLKIPPTNLKVWKGYVNQLTSTYSLPPLGVITEIAVAPDNKVQVRVDYRMTSKVDGESIGELLALREREASNLTAAYPEPGEQQEEAPARASKAASKAKPAVKRR